MRGRKKTQVEQIEDEVKDLKRKNEELMLCNASLAAENNLLKQQISFLQKLAIKSSKSDPFVIENADINSRYLLPVKNSEDEKVRISNQTSASKHFTILGILTILLFIFSNTLGENTKATISFSEQFRNQFDRSLKSLNGSLGSQEEEMKVSVYLGQTFDFLLEQYQTLRTMYSCIKYSIILLYAGYFIWIVYYFLIKKYVKLKIKKI